MYRPIRLIALCALLILPLAACTNTPSSQPDAKATTAAPASDANASDEKADGAKDDAKADAPSTEGIGEHVFMIGMDSPKATVTYMYAEKLGEELERLTDGKMKVDIYTDATLGGDTALLESCKEGNVSMVAQTTAPQVNFIPQLAVFDLPVAYPDIEGVRKALDNPAFMKQINGFYADAGYEMLGYADQTFRVMSSNVPVRKMDDFKGIKIRTMENVNHMDFWKALGAAPTPMAFSELYTGLQQGTVVAQENPYIVTIANKFLEVQKYIVQTNHVPHLVSLIMNKAQYDALSDQEREVLTTAVGTAKAYAREQASALEADNIQTIKDAGVEVIPVTPETYAQIKEAAQPVYDSITEKVGADLVNAYLGK